MLDLAARKLFDRSMRDHLRTEMTLAGLAMAAQRQRTAQGLIGHSDRHTQDASAAYGKELVVVKGGL